MNLDYHIVYNPGKCRCVVVNGEDVVCTATISISGESLTISEWMTDKGWRNKGIGRNALKAILSKIKQMGHSITSVSYNWNGVNAYVLDWLTRNFDAECKCPISVRKYSSDDDKDSHIYLLNTEKFMRYFNIA